MFDIFLKEFMKQVPYGEVKQLTFGSSATSPTVITGTYKDFGIPKGFHVIVSDIPIDIQTVGASEKQKENKAVGRLLLNAEVQSLRIRKADVITIADGSIAGKCRIFSMGVPAFYDLIAGKIPMRTYLLALSATWTNGSGGVTFTAQNLSDRFEYFVKVNSITATRTGTGTNGITRLRISDGIITTHDYGGKQQIENRDFQFNPCNIVIPNFEDFDVVVSGGTDATNSNTLVIDATVEGI